jgi:hypothetical protein
MHVHPPIIAAFDPESAAQAPVEFGIAASRVTQSPLVVAAVVKGGRAEESDGDGDGDGALDRLRLELERRDVDADIRVFELAVAAARTLRSEGRRADAADRFEQALRTYGGDLIPEAGPADWVIGRRDGLRLAAAEAAIVQAVLRGDADALDGALAGEAEALAALHALAAGA